MWHQEGLLCVALESKTAACHLEVPDFRKRNREEISGEKNCPKENGKH